MTVNLGNLLTFFMKSIPNYNCFTLKQHKWKKIRFQDF